MLQGGCVIVIHVTQCVRTASFAIIILERCFELECGYNNDNPQIHVGPNDLLENLSKSQLY
jgi:hypothetical protein